VGPSPRVTFMSRRLLLLVGAVVAVILAVSLLQRQRRGSGQATRKHSPPTSQAPAFFAGAESPAAAIPVALIGRVQDPLGRAVAGAFLALVAENEGEQGPRQRRSISTAAADPQGAFVLPDVPPGVYALTATAPGFLPGSVRVDHARSGGTRSVLLTLRPGGFLISGRVLDTLGGAIGGAQVALVPSGWKDEARGLATAIAGPDGAYRLTVPAGEHRLVFRRDGYSERVLDIRATRDQTIDVRLSAGVRLSGRVVLRDTQQPVAGA
jgi:hypothetical protein